MIFSPFKNEILLGCGGSSPQIIMWDCETNFSIKNPYPQYNSIYTLAIDSEIKKLATGSRNGIIYIHDLNQINNKKLPLNNILIQGSPILSLCWLDNNFLAATDKAGRCFIWDIKKEFIFQSLETQGDIICSLFYKNSILYGLSMNAKLQLWDLESRKPLMNFKIPALPKIGSLVKAVFWPANNALVFPGNDGRLSQYDIDNHTLSTFDAHKGSFYSISIYGDYLASFGIHDYQLKIWRKDSNDPIFSYHIDKMVISSVCFPNQQNRFLLTDSNGSAYEYILESQGFKLVQQLPGQNYRICISLRPDDYHKFEEKYQRKKVHEIVDKILKCNDQISDSELNRYYEELSEIGFDHVRLELQANHAENSGDLFKAIELNIELLGIIPKNSKETCSIMERYATLLEKTWNIAEACSVSKEILKIDPTNNCAKKVIDTYEFSDVNQDSWIIEPDIPLEVVLKSATAVNNICGRYVIKSLDKITCEKIVLTPELILKKYKEIQNKKNSDPLSKASIDHVRFFSNNENENVQILSFSNESDSVSKYIQFAARVICNNSGTIIIPIILFNCSNYDTKKTSGSNTDNIFDTFNLIKSCPSSSIYLRTLHKFFHYTLQRLITEIMAKEKFENDLL